MKPYNQANQTKEQEVREMFDRIAPKYDLLNHTLSVGIDKIWRRRVVSYIRRLKPQRILDLATGTGDLAIAMARRIHSAKVLGVDLSEGMLREAQRKINERALSERIELRQGVAEDLKSLEDNTFDVATVAFGVRNFDNMEAGLREIYRVLRPGGEVVILEFSNPTHPLIKGLYRWYSHSILPRIGGVISRERLAYEYLPASVDEFPLPEAFMQRLEAAGFHAPKARSQSFGIARIYTATK